MNRATTLALLLVVALLGALAYRQARFEIEHPPEDLEPLFKGVEPTRVVAFRLENLERSNHVRIERDARGVWFLTDPIAYPAAPEIVEQVFGILTHNLAEPVPSVLAERAREHLKPERGFLEVEETLPEGGVRRTRVNLGAVDLDGQRVYIERDGRVLRTMRNLETLLQRDLPDLRSRRLFRVDPNGVVELLRQGRVYLDDAAPSVDWSVQAEGAGWRMYQPVRGRIDGEVFGYYLPALASTRIARFVTDLPDADLAQYGLAPAWFSLKLRDRRGAESTVEIGQNASRKAFARHPGLPHVYELADRDWNNLIEGVTNLSEFMEREFFRLRRDQLQEVMIENAGRATRLVRAPDGNWSVDERLPGETGFGLPVPAENATVEALLTRLETQAKLATYFFDRTPADVFPSNGRTEALWVTPYGDQRQGGWIGPLVRTAEGTELRAFLREDEGLVAGLDPAVGELLSFDASHFWRRIVWDVTEVHLRGLALSHGERTKRYVRGDGFTWRHNDADVPARELRGLLDSILFLKADGEVPPMERAELTDLVRIELLDADGGRSTAELGLNPAGEVELICGVRRARAKDQGLHAAIRALVDG